MELKRATKKIPSEQNLRLLSSLILSISAKQGALEDRCIAPWKSGETYQANISYVSNLGYIWLCKTTNNDVDFSESKWIKMSDNITELSKDDISALINLSPQEISKLSDIISTEIRLDKTFSSSDTYTRIQAAIDTAKEYTNNQLGKSVKPAYRVVSSTSEVTETGYFYLISNGTNFDMYVLSSDGVVVSLGTSEIDLSDYAKLTDLADYLKKTDATSTYATIATVDGKVDKTNILTTTSTTATDDQVYSAKLVNDNAIKNKSLKTYTSLEQLGLTAPVTVSEIFLAIPNNGSLAVISCDDTTTTVTDVPSGYGVLTIEKGEAGRFSILFKKSAGSSIAPNELYVGQLQGSDGSGLKWEKVMYGDKTTVVDKNSTNDTVPTSLAVRNAMLGMNVTNNTTYGDDVLYFPCGIYKIVNNATAATMKNLPISSAGLLHVHSVNSHNSDLNTTTYVYRMYIFIPIGKRDVYVRNVSTGGTAGVFTADTGWKKICTTKVEDVPVTNIAPSDTTIFPNFKDNPKCNYCVRSGICYVVIWDARITSTGTIITDVTLPKCANSCGGTFLTGNGDATPHAYVYVSSNNGELCFDVKDANIELYGSFSYPVAEN